MVLAMRVQGAVAGWSRVGGGGGGGSGSGRGRRITEVRPC